MSKKAEKELSDRIAREFATELRKRLGDRVQRIILYGSRARGDFWVGSDFDVLVIVSHRSKDIDNLILNLEGEYLDRYEVLICSLAREAKEWENCRGYPFAESVEEEGVTL